MLIVSILGHIGQGSSVSSHMLSMVQQSAMGCCLRHLATPPHIVGGVGGLVDIVGRGSEGGAAASTKVVGIW